jgi:ADP-dependent NAD(P)H-hydrate dehydratase / NAD(P)H-hydrate epimerase
MARAGLAVARLALAAWPRARRVLAFAGPGNNGGDALVAARWLARQGLALELVLLGDDARRPDDARWALAAAQGLAITRALPERCAADLVLDGLLGVGAARAPEGAVAEAIRRINAGAAPVLAIDLPTGLDADRGSTHAGLAVRAAQTLSLLTLKPGLFTAEGRDHAGRVWLATLGVAAGPSPLTLTGPAAEPTAPHASHKGRFGDLVVIGGAPGMTGAVLLAARAGLAAGAGRVFVGALDPMPVDPARPELMFRPAAGLLAPEMLATATAVVGCGGGEPIRPLLPAALAHAARLVLDADALNAIAAEPGLRQALRARAARGRPTVLTPHPREAARLLGCSAAEVQADRLGAARTLAQALAATVVLKGSGTLIASPDGRIAINPSGNARLATAGTGDVLAGWLGGHWAREGGDGTPVAADAVFRHGRAAEVAPGRGPLLAADLVDALQAGG